MGGRTKRAKKEEEKKDWIFKVDLELNFNRSKTEIAFLSGLERTYYPEDPGYSKFALVYQNSGFETETPPCTFIPNPDLVDKPISNKGYGIGGLSAPRFPPLTGQDLPSPDKYQPEQAESLLKPNRRPVPDQDNFLQLSPKDPLFLKKQRQLRIQRALQCYVSFGTYRGMSRFGKRPLFNTAGVGTYNAKVKETPRLQITSSFGRSPVLSEPSTEVKCVYAEDETCIECGVELDVSDFYRTRYSVNVPLPETRPVEYLGKNFPKGMKHVNLCNVCYYRASIGESQNWPKNKLRWLFKKTRTCAFIHEHQGLQQVIHKASCKTYKKLQRKEAIMAKYYADRVEESLQPESY